MSKKCIKKTVNDTYRMKKPSIFRIVVSYITAYSMMFMNVVPALATEISGVTGNNGVYDISADKISGNTGFRQYEKFELSEGDIANLQFKKDAQEYGKFVNLVDNKVDINGIINTVRGDAFYNGHAIFVSPNGIVVGASGVLNVGSLTMMAPSKNAYDAFKKGYGANIKDVEFDMEHENYRSLIRNSSGTIEINGKIFAKDAVNVYGRQIKVQKNESGEGSAAVFAGVQDQKVLTKAADADTLFNSLVNKNIENATDFNLKNGKISLVTNKANEEVITTVKTSEENGKKYKTTTEINTALMLKKETKEEIKSGNEQDANKKTIYSIDKTYKETSLSSNESSITISGAKIAANNVDVQANAEAIKIVDEDTIKTYSEAAKKAEQSTQTGQGNQSTQTGQSGQTNNADGSNTDQTSGYKIPKEFRDVVPEASATVTVSSSKIHGDTISIRANAVNKTQTYIQLMDPIWEKWLNTLGADLLLRVLNKMSDEPLIPDGTDLPWFSVNMVKEYFSDKAYTSFDGAKAVSSVNIIGSEIVAKDSVDIEANSGAVTSISTGRLDSHPLFFYGLGVKAQSDVNISAGTTIKTTGDESAVNLAALAQTEDDIKYDSSNFLAISDKPAENNQESGSGNSSSDNGGNTGNNNTGSNTGNNNTDSNTGNNNTDSNTGDNNTGESQQGGQQSTVSAYNLTLLNNSIFSDANVKVDGSTIETKDFNAKAIDFNKSEIEMKNISNVGANSEKTGIAAAMLINHTRTNSNVEISNKANIEAENDVKLLAQNINYLQNSVESEVKAKAQNYDIETKDLATYDPTYTIKAYDWLNKKFLGKVTSKIGDILDKVQSEISGSAIWNDEQNTSTTAVNNSTVTAGNVDVLSNMVDFTINTAEANAGAIKKFSAGAAIVVNDQSNTNNAKVLNNATITADENVNISATTQLPMNPMQLKIGQKLENGDKNLELFVGGSFDGGSSVNSWDSQFTHTELSKILNWDSAKMVWNSIKQPRIFAGSNKMDMRGLFNNLVKAEATSDGFGIAGSVLANSIVNNTNAFIENSKVSAADGNVNINAANSVINYNGAGKVDFLIDAVNDLIEHIKAKSDRTPQEEEVIGKFGIGGSVLVDKYTNNANAYIKSSDVSAANKTPTTENAAQKGNININAASEEGYINLAVTGGKANWLALQGSVNVQRIDGKTKAYIADIADTQKVEADNINVIAGKASIAPKKTNAEEDGDPVELDEDTGELSVRDQRDVKDTVTNISIIGANAQQEGSGVSVGASVDVTKISKEVEATVTNSTISANKDVSVVADTSSKKIDVLMAGAFAGGVSTNIATQQAANAGTSTGEDRPQQMQNAGNWMDEIDAAQDDEEDVMNLNNLFAEDGNDAAKEGAKGLNGTDGRESSSSQGSSTGTTSLTNGSTGANPTTAQKNISVALAGAVDVTNDYTKTTAKVENSTINAGKEVNVTADNDILAVQVNGALAKSSTVSAGAGVNIYNNKSETLALVDNSTIKFNSANATGLNVTADADIDLIDVTAGIAAASTDGGFSASVGGSFGFNKLHNTVKSQVFNNTTVKTDGDNVPDVGVKVEAKDDSKIWNTTGAAGFGNSSGVNIGAGIAATLNYSKKTITAAIIDSTLSNVKDVTVNADLKQDYNTIAVAAELSTGKASSFTLDGAVNTEWNGNRVTALAKDSTLTASGDVEIKAKADIKNQSLAGAVDFQTSKFGVGVGIGSIINVNKSAIKAEADGLTVEKSKSLNIQADEKEDLKFLAANLGIKTGSGATININGIANVFLSEVIADAINNSVFNSDGNVSITAGYDNKLQGITAVAEFAKGLVVGPNLIGNVYNNTVTANLQHGSEIQKASKVAVNSTSVELMNLIPVSAGASTSIAAVAADLNANIVKNTVEALLGGKVTESSSVLVNATDDTAIYTRGGTVAAGSATVVIGGSVNVDVISKTVHAYVNSGDVTTSGDMSVFASSINSMGGTKGADQKYTTDDVTTEAYRNKMLNKDAKGNYVGLKEGSSFANWNMFYDLSGGKTAAIAGATIVKSIHNEIQAEILNSEIKANNLNVAANEYSIKNIIAGTLEGAGTLAVGVNVLVMRDKSETKALIGNNSKLTITDTINMNASNKKDNQQIVVAGGGAGVAAANTNTVVNKIDDEVIAQIDNQNGVKEISAGTINIRANEDMNASHILVAGSGAGTVALSVAPIVNTYNGTVDASIKNAKVNDAAINVTAQNNIATFDVDAGVAGAGNVAGTAVAIKNNYTGHTKAYMDNATINTSSAIAIAADAAVKSENWIGALAVTGVGASLLVNLVLNNVVSETEAGIKNSTIQNAGDITINTNNGKKDDMKNRALSIGFTAQGAALVVGVVQNIYSNTVKSYAENNAITKAVSMALNANSDRKLDNKTIGATAAAIGAGAVANALVNQIDSSTTAVVDAKSKTMNIDNALNLSAKDNTAATNSMGMIAVAGMGAAIGGNINLYYANNLANAKILSNSDGQINAGSSSVIADMINGLDNMIIGVSLGAGTLAADVAVIRLGKRTSTYSEAEQGSKIKDAVDYTQNIYNKSTTGDASNVKNLYTPTSSSDDIKTGAVAEVNGNLKTTNDTKIEAKSKIKGLKENSDTLELRNVNVSGGIASANVGVKNIKLASNTLAEISGGKVESTNGDVSVKADSKADVKLKNTEVTVAGVALSGAGAIYNNTSETVAQVKDATVRAKDLNIVSKSDNKSEVDSTSVIVSGANAIVDIAENTDTNKSAALITGNVDIDTSGKLTLRSTTNTELDSAKAVVKVSVASLVGISKNENEVKSINRALIENATGSIKTNGLEITTDYGKMYAYSKSNVTSVQLADIANIKSVGAHMNADFKSGIDSIEGLTINNKGTTTINTAKDITSNQEGIVAKSEIHNVGVSLLGFYNGTASKAQNTAKSSTVLKVKEHTANGLDINANLKSTAKAEGGATNVSLAGVSNFVMYAKDESTLNVNVDGVNNIVGSGTGGVHEAKIKAKHQSEVRSDASAVSAGLIAGHRMRLTSELVSNTTGNIGGTLNADRATVDFDTTRSSVLNKSSSSGGVIDVGDAGATNTLTGSSVLTVSASSSKEKAVNAMDVKNKSTNTFDMTSSDGHGGLLSISEGNTTTTFNTSTTTNLVNTNINSSSDVKYEVSNNAFIKDTATSRGGGLIAVYGNYHTGNFTSAANLNLNNAKINAKNIDLKSVSDLRTSDNGYISYTGAAGGFVAGSTLELRNTLDQTSSIGIVGNSKLDASENAKLSAKTASGFKQKVDSTAGAFVAVPRARSYLTVTNNNNVNIANGSKVKAGNELEINFDSNNDLASRTNAEAHHFGFKDPVAESYLTLNINNNLNNSGSLEAGNLVDINYMGNSTNNLEQFAYSEAHAAIATTTENGELKKDLRNNLNIASGGDITSGKSIDVNYSSGVGNSSSYIGWKTVSYALFGIPIKKSDNKSNASIYHIPSLKIDGKMVAGQSNSRYMKINRDGSVDLDTLVGFYNDDYKLYDNQSVEGDEVKQRSLAAIEIEINNIDSTIVELSNENESLNKMKTDAEKDRDATQAKLDELNGYITDGNYELLDENSSFNDRIGTDIKAKILKTSANESDRITEAEYNAIMAAYKEKMANAGNPSMIEFLKDSSTTIMVGDEQLVLTEDQLSTISSALENTANSDIKNLVVKTSADEANRITEAQYNAIVTAYNAKISNRNKPLTISDFLAGADSSVTSLSDAQKQTILDAYRLADSDDVKGLIVKTSANEENRLTEDQYNTLVTAYNTAYNNKLAEIAEQNKEISLSDFLNDSSNTIMVGDAHLSLTDAQKQTIRNMETNINGKLKVSNSGVFLIYDNKYVAVSNPKTVDNVTSCDEIKQYNTELSAKSDLIQQYKEKLNANEAIKQNLLNRKTVLGNEQEEIINAKYEDRNEVYSIVFYDLYSDTANVNISGADNRSISGNGNIIVAQPGLQVDNYSNRSLIFNDIDFGSSASGNGLTINGKDHAIFMDTQKAVSGMDTFFYWYGWGWNQVGKFSDIPDTNDGNGVHYKSGTQGVKSGITIHTYYDSNSPFIDKYAPESGTIFTGDIINSGNQMTVTNNSVIFFIGQTVNSGKTTIATPSAIIAELTSDKVDINSNPENWEQNKKGTIFNLGEGSYLFGGNAVVVEAEKINIKGDVVSGYKNRGITITDDMLKEENLIVDPNTIDPVTGEGDKNLVNLGGSALSAYLNDGVNYGNVKAIYKDGEIHLFNLPRNILGSGVRITAKEGTSSTVEGNVTVHNNHTTVNIDNQSINNIPLNIYDLYNEGADDDIEKSLENVTIVTADNGTGSIITDNNSNASVTYITSTGSVKLHGTIANNVIYPKDELSLVSKPDHSNGSLNILVKNGGFVVDEYKNFFELVDNAIVNSGDINIKLQNNASAVINGKIHNTDGTIFIGNHTDNTAGDITLNAPINNKKTTDSGKGDIIIDTQGSVSVNDTISNEKKGIEITAHKGITTAENASITGEVGHIVISNLETSGEENSGLQLNGDVVTERGTVTIINKQGEATIAGDVKAKLGDINISHSDADSGQLNISGDILLDGTASDNGEINVNSTKGKTILSGEVKNTVGDIDIKTVGLDVTKDSNIETGGGNIFVNNSDEDITLSGTIENKAQKQNSGNITITNSGKNMSVGGKVSTGKGNIEITNSGADVSVGGKVSTEQGNIEIANSGKDLSTTGEIDIEEEGNINIINETAATGQMNVGGTISGKHTMINIANNATTKTPTAISAEIVANNNGFTNINSNAAVNIETNGGLNMTETSSIRTTGEIFNTLSGDNIKNGKVTITNNAKNMNLNGSIQVNAGDLIITNKQGAGDATIGGFISDEKGDIAISNGAGTMMITTDIEHNWLNPNAKGVISIDSTEGSKALNINGKVISWGNGKNISGDSVAIKINSAATEGLTLSEAISARVGDIIITNTKGNLTSTAEISNTENGDISITSSAGNTSVGGKIIAKSGNIEIESKTGAGDMDVSAQTENKGGMYVINGGNGDLLYTGEATTTSGPTRIINKATGGVVNAGGKITGNNSPVSITNEATTQMNVSTNIKTDQTFVSISSKGGLKLTNKSVIDSGDTVTVKNYANNLELEGTIKAKQGVKIANEGEKAVNAAVSGTINNESGNVEISNSGSGKMTLSADIDNKSGNTNITNGGTDLEYVGDIDNAGGNTDISNTKGKLTVNGVITNTGGNTTITNTGNTTEISKNISNSGGSISVSNKAGGLAVAENVIISNASENANNGISVENRGGELSLAGDIFSCNKGNVTVNNSGDKAQISGDITAQSGNITVENSNEGALNVSGDLTTKDDGSIAVTNSSKDGMSFSGAVDVQTAGNVTIGNTGGKLNITSNANISDASGNITIDNSGAKGADIAGTITNANGNTSINNTNGLTYTAGLTNFGGNTSVVNSGDADMSGTITNAGGHATITNSDGKLGLSTTVANSGGALSIRNNGKGTVISGDVDNTGGNVTIDNIGGDLELAATATIDNNGAGDMNINNSGDGKFVSNAALTNKESGNITIDNSGAKGADIAGTITNANGNVMINNTADSMVISGKLTDDIGNINIINQGKALTISGIIEDKSGNIAANNSGNGAFELTQSGIISNLAGDVALNNSNIGGMKISGNVNTQKGEITLDNTSVDGAVITTSGNIRNMLGNITLNNSGANGLKVEGKVLAEDGNITVNNRDSDLTVGELASANDNYIITSNGNVNINQVNGDILNGVIDTNGGKHQNADKGNPQQSYKTLIVTGGDLVIDVRDGNIGFSQLQNPASSIEASTRDWTDSININVGGMVTAIAANENKSDARLINLRTKDSDLRIKNVTADGDILLTAADWKQADVKPTPDDENYFKGYSIMNMAGEGKTTVTGRNISIISSDNIGEKGNKLTYMQDTAAEPKSSVNFEAENDLFITGDSNSASDTIIHQMISKHGMINLDLKHDAVIGKITSGKGLEITQQARNLTIYEIGSGSTQGQNTVKFEDMLYPHDDLVYGSSSDNGSNYTIPQYVNIQVLDAIDNPERGDSNLKIYSLTVRGNNGENDNFYPDGGRLADVTLMADNIYANSDKALNSNVSTKDYSEGYKQTQTTYTEAQFGGKDDKTVYAARGINAYGEGTPLSLDIIGVDRDVVNAQVNNANRSVYKEQTPVTPRETFKNNQASIYDYDFRAKNAVISVNDYADNERGVEFDTLYADNAYINTMDTNLKVHDGYINNYAEIRNGNREADNSRYLVVVDNDYRRLIPSDVQLYTQKTGSFGLTMDNTIITQTTAPVVHYDWRKLVNTFSDENSFVRLGLKETELRQKAKDYYGYDNIYVMPEGFSAKYEVWKDSALISNMKIVEISRDTAIIVNRDNWQVGEERELELMFDDVQTKIRCRVIDIDKNYATVKLLDMPANVYNRLAYRYLKMADK